MSIKELKLVPNYILIQVLLTKGMANAEYIFSAGPGPTYNIEQSHREDLSSH